MFDAIIGGAQPQQLGGAGAFNLFGAPNQQVRARTQSCGPASRSMWQLWSSQQRYCHLTRPRLRRKTIGGDAAASRGSCPMILCFATMTSRSCTCFHGKLEHRTDVPAQGANAQLGGELLLPIVARFLDQLRSPDTSARLMPSASYSLPEGRRPAQSTAS